MSAATKRSFLFRAFHPHGPYACAMSGMLAESPDVEHREFTNTHHLLNMIPDKVVMRVLERARWFVEAMGPEVNDLDSATPVPERSEETGSLALQEILVKFYLAMMLEAFDEQLVR